MTTDDTQATESTREIVALDGSIHPSKVPTSIGFAQWQPIYRAALEAHDAETQRAMRTFIPTHVAIRDAEEALTREFQIGEREIWRHGERVAVDGEGVGPSPVMVRIAVNTAFNAAFNDRCIPTINYQTADLMHASWLSSETLRRLATLQNGIDAYVRGELASLPFVAPWEDPAAWGWGAGAGAIAHEFVRHLLGIQGPLAFLDYERMLTPNNADRFEKTIPRGAMDWLQTKAKEKLQAESAAPDDDPIDQEYRAHLTMIAEGRAPFGYTITENDE